MLKILLALLLMTTPAFAVTNWNKAIPATGDNLTAWPAAVTAQWSILDTLISNYRRGEKLIYKNATTITVSLGEVVVSNSGGSLRIFLQDVGNTDITTANLDTGSSFSASTTYYVYSGTSSSTAANSTYYISLSSSAPSGVTYYAPIGSFKTDSSSNIVAYQIYSTAYGSTQGDSAGVTPNNLNDFDYGTSTSAFTVRAPGTMKIAHGQTGTSISGSSSITITNLPFTSGTSYSVTTGQYSAFNCAVSGKSGSQFTITNTHNDNTSGNGNCDWVAIGS